MAKRRHKTELRDRTYKQSYCIQPGCENEGKPAEQGVCFSKVDRAFEVHIEGIEQRAALMVKEMKQILRGKSEREKLRYLYEHIHCTWMNQELHIDMLIAERAKNAKLRAKLRRGNGR